MKHGRIYSILLYLVLCAQSSYASDQQNTIRFSCSVNEKSDHFRYFTELYTHAFEQLGYQFSMRSLPPLRELALLREQKIDGVCARTDGILSTPDTETLIRVDEVIAKSHMVIYGADSDIRIDQNNLQSLQKYRVGYRRGYLGLVDSLKGVGLKNLQAIERPTHGVRQLASGRIDVYIDQHIAIVSALTEHPLLEDKIHNLGSYKKRRAYSYLIPQHTKLAPALAIALKQSKRSIALPKIFLPIDE
ncbi:MAG: hypothetical protein ACRBBW_11800 [Cellvibrionaceae bacterium]